MNYQKLFDYFSREHGLTLLETEMQEICNIVNDMQWISVEDELPENADGGKQNIKVLAYGYSGSPFECVYNPLLQIFMDNFKWQEIKWITYWQPLPKAPIAPFACLGDDQCDKQCDACKFVENGLKLKK